MRVSDKGEAEEKGKRGVDAERKESTENQNWNSGPGVESETVWIELLFWK